MLQVSTGFKTKILGPHAFSDIFARGAIKVFDGFRPETADGPEPVSPLGLITLDGGQWSAPGDIGNGLLFAQNGPYIYNRFGDRLVFNVTRSGIPLWGRLLAADADTGLLSYTAARIDFSISADPEDHSEMLLLDGTVQVGERVPVSNFLYTLPPLVAS